jgi:hypothetical protein
MGLGLSEQPLHLRQLPDGCLAAGTARQVPLKVAPFRWGQRAQDVTRVIEASHVHHGVSSAGVFARGAP